MKLRFDFDGAGIIDDRAPHEKIINGEIHIKYTYLTDDITKGEKPKYTPYRDRVGKLCFDGEKYVCPECEGELRVYEDCEGLMLQLSSKSCELSEFGLALPFNFMSKKRGGEMSEQLLFNSSYVSDDGRIVYAYLTKPNGNNLGIAMLSHGDGWKMDYSEDSYGHFFNSLNFYSNFDKAYKTERKQNELRLFLFPTTDFSDFLERLARLYALPFLNYRKNGARLGESVELMLFGEADSLLIEFEGMEKHVPYSSCYTVENEGITFITPIKNGKKGASVSIFGYLDEIDLCRRALNRVDLHKYGKENGNLCECQCWASAMLRYLMLHKDTLTDEEISNYESRLLDLLENRVTVTDEDKAIHRVTILDKPHGKFPAYNVYNSDRIQEQSFGITLLLDAYKYFGRDKYLTYATRSLDSYLDFYQKESGALVIREDQDYSTVCSPMITLVDMANFLKNRDPVRSERYFGSAKRLAEHLYRRGFDFPTESPRSEIFGKEVEEGSMSCTALSLLYYCKNAERVEKYIDFSKKVLDLHESWMINTPLCQTYRSTLRWWETLWEGDMTGPSICAGHPWTLWRSEAEYLYYVLTGDKEYERLAASGFITNISKIDKNGRTYATYTPDLISGGGFAKSADEVTFELSPRIPKNEQCWLVHYLWIRYFDTFGACGPQKFTYSK